MSTNKKRKDGKMRGYGSKGYQALVDRLGSPEAVTAHYKRLAKKRWAKHPEQRSAAHRAKTAKLR